MMIQLSRDIHFPAVKGYPLSRKVTASRRYLRVLRREGGTIPEQRQVV
ncbi:hypothetical protein [Aminivibrio sp.]